MHVIIDGKKVECLNSVKVIFDDGNRFDEETKVEPHLTVTSEGVVLDNLDEVGEVWSTMAWELDELIMHCL